MSNKQPEALRLAEALTIDGWKNAYNVDHETLNDTAAELIRLHTANVELVALLKWISEYIDVFPKLLPNASSWNEIAKEAIKKHGEA